MGAGKLILADNIFIADTTAGVASITGSVDLNGGVRMIDSNAFVNLILDGAVSNGGVTFGGDIELRGTANTYNGHTVVEDVSEVSLNKPAADGALRGDVTIQGAVFLLRNEQILAAPGNEVFLENGGRLELNGFSETVQDLTLKSGDVSGGGGTLSVLGTITQLESVAGSNIRAKLNLQGGRVFSVQGKVLSGELDLSGVVSNGAVIKTGPGTLWLLNISNTYADGTFLNDGKIRASGDGSLGSAGGGITFDGGVLEVDGIDFSTTARPIIWGTSGGGFDIRLPSGVFTLPIQSLGGSGSLMKLGAGKLVLIAPQSYTGGTTIDAGVLEGNTQSLQGNVVNNGAIIFNQAFDGTYAGNLTGTGGLTKSGAGTLVLSGFNNYGGSTTINAGRLTIASSGVVGSPNVVAGAIGELHGDGNIVGNVENGGLVSPGMSPGALNITGNYTQTADGELLIELASASNYDQLLVTNQITLGGTLSVNLIDGFTPSIGQTFTIVTSDDVDGMFLTELLPSVPNLEFDVIYNVQSVVLMVLSALAGDYNGNGAVDAADYVVWRKNVGAATLNNRDPNGMGVVGQADYDFWRMHFGAAISGIGAGSGAADFGELTRAGASSSQAPVPEPASLVLVLAALLPAIFMRPCPARSRESRR